MKIQIQGPLNFRDVLPSALTILLLGALFSFFSAPWQWFGQAAWLVVLCGIALGVIVYLLGFFASCLPWTKTESMHDLLNTLHQLFKNFTWKQIFIVSVLAGVGEELLIRGVLQTFLISSVGVFWGIVSASLIFGLLHFMTKIYVLLTFVLGLLFGIAFHFSDSMVMVMLAHTVYDIIAFAMIVKYPHLLGLASSDRKTPIISNDDTFSNSDS